MTATAAYPATMPDIKGETGGTGMWHYPSAAVPSSSSRFAGMMEHSPTSPTSHLGRPRSSHHAATAAVAAAAAGLEQHQHQQSHQQSHQQHAQGQHQQHQQHQHQQHPYHATPAYSRYSHDESDYDQRPVGGGAHPALTPQSSFPSLKRTYSQTDGADYGEMRSAPGLGSSAGGDDGSISGASKLGAGHDQKLLSFKKTADKHTILDSRGRMQQLDMNAQLHGMFFLSEMPPAGADNAGQPELTCYRRNLFQISGSLVVPRGQLSVVVGETGEAAAVASTEVTISAIESVDGNAVRLIVIPWKTPPPNTPELSTGPDAEPVTLPLIPFADESADADGEYAVYPIGWRRLQFRVATANNGRRKELQQHFILHLKVVGTLANGNKVVLSESTTSPIVVRGRSPRNFQARKEIPLLGSSAGSRGQALVETGLGIVAGPLTGKPTDKLHSAGGGGGGALDMQVPRGQFTFNTKLPGVPMPAMRSNTYPTAFPPQSHIGISHPVSGASYPPSSLASDYPKLPSAGYDHDMSATPTSALPVDAAAAAHSMRYAYATQPGGPAPLATSDAALSVPRYVDSNPRPTKSPRTMAAHDSAHSAGAVSNDSPSEYRYTSSYPPPMGGSAPGSAAGSAAGDHHHAAAVAAAAAAAAAHHVGTPQTPYPSANDGSQSAVQTPRDYYASHSSGTWGTPAAAAAGEPGPYVGHHQAAATGGPAHGHHHQQHHHHNAGHHAGHPAPHHPQHQQHSAHPHPHEGRSYTFPHAGYKAAAAPSSSSGGPASATHGSAAPGAGASGMKAESAHHHHQQHPQAVYSAGPHGGYDSMGNYWNAN